MITAAYVDTLQVVYEYLIAETTIEAGANVLASIVSTRVYIGDPKTRPTEEHLVVKVAGGTMRVSAPVCIERVQIDCYAAASDLEGARALALKCIYQMHRAKAVQLTTGVLMSAEHVGGGQPMWMPAGVRPFIPIYFTTLVQPKE
jgi:hypothetical protein